MSQCAQHRRQLVAQEAEHFVGARVADPVGCLIGVGSEVEQLDGLAGVGALGGGGGRAGRSGGAGAGGSSAALLLLLLVVDLMIYCTTMDHL